VADGTADGDPALAASRPPRVVIEFDPGAEVAGVGPATKFRGRLELYTALERARAGESGAATEKGPLRGPLVPKDVPPATET
jgi:hypothetical protein